MTNTGVIAKKTRWRITIYLGIIFVVAAILLFLSQYYLYSTLPYNSDDVAGMYMIKYFSIKNLPLLMPPDTFIFKIPFNIIGDLIFPGSRKALFVSAYIANLISLALFIFSIAVIVKIATKKQIKPFLFAICVFAFAFIPSLVFTFSLRGPNNRTIEIGIGMALVTLVAYFWSQNSKTQKLKNSKLAIISVLLSIFLGLYFYNDPAYIYFIGIPILIVGLYEYYITRQKKYLFPSFIVLSGLIFYKIISIMFHELGIRAYSTKGNFIPLDSLFSQLLIGAKGILDFFYANFFNLPIFNMMTILHILYASLIVIITISVIWGFVQHKPMYNILSFSITIILLVYLISDRNTDSYSARYLIMLPFLSVPLVYMFFSKFVDNKNVRILIAIVTLIALINLSIPIYRLSLAMRSHDYGPNQVNSLIGASLDNNKDYTKGYSAYWMANINSYLNNLDKPITPLICSDNTVRVFDWVMYTTPVIVDQQDKNYVVVSNNNLLPDITSNSGGVQCTIDEVIKYFGEPAKIVQMDNSTSIYYYDYNLALKFNKKEDFTSP
jgi:hypothetical protein